MRIIYQFITRLTKLFSRQNLYRYLREEIANIKGNSKILNVGSGGEVGKLISSIKNVEITSIDIKEERKPDIVLDVCDMAAFDDNTFDIVFIIAVLEHVPNQQKAITEIYRVLKPGGKLIMEMPFIFPMHGKPVDYYRYTKFGLKYLLREWRDIRIRPRNDYLHTIIVLLARLLFADAKRDRIIGFFVFSFILLLYPILILVSKSIDSDNITSGYFITCYK